MSDQITLELITNILCQLPVKTLLRFRCMSKPWCSQIDDPDFIKLHLKHSMETKSDLSVILSDNRKLYSVDFDSLDKAVKMNLSFKLPLGFDIFNRVLGSCNGLICICNFQGAISLLNPLTRQHQILPFMPINYQRGFGKAAIAGSVYGFGYHPISDDYKVVQITQFIITDLRVTEFDIMVYSLKTNRWRKLRNINMPYYLNNFKNPGVLVGGSLHWRMPADRNEEITQIIVAFDLCTEDFRDMPPPPGCLHRQVHFEVGILEGCLTVLAMHVNFNADLWVIKQYGVKESWTKLLSVPSPERPVSPGLLAVVEIVKPLAYSKNGSQVLLQYKMESLFWYDLEKKSAKDIHFHGMEDTLDASFIFVGSLVALNFHKGTHGKKQQAQEQKKNIRKNRDDFLSKGFKLVL